MKKLLAALIFPVLLSACNEDRNKTDQISGPDPAFEGKKNATGIHYSDTSSGLQILSPYFEIKNALANDDRKQAAKAAKNFINALSNLDSLTETLESAREMAEHIAKHGKDIEHQRFHFQMLSNDIYELIKDVPKKQALYWYFCPLYKEKGGSWLSETRELKNPYLGKKMPACGEIKEAIK
jgi:ribosomal protein S15P/S13E